LHPPQTGRLEGLIPDLFRFAWLLTGNAESAWTITSNTLGAAWDRAKDFQDPAKARLWLISQMRESVLAKQRNGVESPDLPGIGARIHKESEPLRSALAAVAANLGTTSEIGTLFKVDRQKVEDSINEIAPTGTADPTATVREAVEDLEMPEGLEDRVESWNPEGTFNYAGLLKQPAGIAVLLALLFLGTGLVWQFVQKSQSFTGVEFVEDLLDRLNTMTGEELEPVDLPASDLGDWFVMKGLDGFSVPERFGAYQAQGCRMMRVDGGRVAQAAIVDGEQHVLFHVFEARQHGVAVVPEGEWKFVSRAPWQGAIQQTGSKCFLVVMRDDADVLRAWLEKPSP
jgi:DNA-directed RNA polymerase specialized sigma24 family protein